MPADLAREISDRTVTVTHADSGRTQAPSHGLEHSKERHKHIFRHRREVIIMGARRAHDEDVVSSDGDHDHVESSRGFAYGRDPIT